MAHKFRALMLTSWVTEDGDGDGHWDRSGDTSACTGDVSEAHQSADFAWLWCWGSACQGAQGLARGALTLEGLVRNSLSKEGDNWTKSELNYVQSTTWETSLSGDPDPDPQVKVISQKS